MSDKKLLTPLELKVMNSLWKVKKAFVKEVLESWDEPKPAYNTISTTIRILEEKGFVGHQAFGRTHQYFPIISKFEYQKTLMGNILENAFSGSATNLVSALLGNDKVNKEDLKDIEDLLKKED